MNISFLCCIPSLVEYCLAQGVVGTAISKQIVNVNYVDLHKFSDNTYGSVDDKPYGGGAGMLISASCIAKAIASQKLSEGKYHKVLLSNQGRVLDQKKVCELAEKSNLMFICGRYEGVDVRIEDEVDELVSIGDYVLSGGEIASVVIADSVIRTLPNVLGNEESLAGESYQSSLLASGKYTLPRKFQDKEVPQVLVSGSHTHIKQWQKQDSLGRTFLQRPDILKNKNLTASDIAMIQEYLCKNNN